MTDGTEPDHVRRGRAVPARSAGPASGRPRPKVKRDSAGRRKGPRRGKAPSSLSRKEELARLSESLVWRRVPPSRPYAVPRFSPKPLTVLMVGWEFPPMHSGGLGVHSFELVKELTRMGHRVLFVTPFSGPYTEVPGVTFRFPGDQPAPDGTWLPAYSVAEAAKMFGGELIDAYNDWVASLPVDGVDVIHVHDWFGTVGGVRLAKRTGVPLVLTIHSTEYDRSLGHPWAHILDRERLGVAAANRVIAVSQHLGRQLIDRYAADPQKVRVVYNAVRPSDRLAPLEGQKEIVLYLGRLAAMKGVDTFLRAAQKVTATHPAATFVVAGEGPEFPRLLALAAHLGVSDRVLFLGKVTDEERSLLLASASVFVLPSVVEPFGIAALEAMAAGVPSIISKTSGVAEMASGVFAVDFWDIDEFASRIMELLEYPELRRSMGEAGRWDALKEGWPERALETLGVYLEVLQARSAGA